MGGFGRRIVHILGITDHEANYRLILSIIFDSFYYLCRMYGIQCGCKDAKRVTDREARPLSAVIYADNPVHFGKVSNKTGIFSNA